MDDINIKIQRTVKRRGSGEDFTFTITQMKVKQTDPSDIEDKTHIINMIKIYKSQEIFRKKINKGVLGKGKKTSSLVTDKVSVTNVDNLGTTIISLLRRNKN